MRALRVTVSVLFVVVLCFYILFSLWYARTDKTYPSIRIDSDRLTVPLNATNADLLKGVTAYDEKDGDITDKIIVESISRFVEKGVSVIRYSVCDNDKHVASASRKIVYDNYTSPRFYLRSSLVFPINQTINIRNLIGATDAIDGDISDKVIITADDYSIKSDSVFYVDAKVTNSKGDTILLSLPVRIEERSLAAPEITLRDYIVYCHVGDSVKPEDSIVSAYAADGTDLRSAVDIDTNLNTNTGGIYEVHYRVKDTLGRTGHVTMLVLVEE